jgi:hypothetical protein
MTGGHRLNGPCASIVHFQGRTYLGKQAILQPEPGDFVGYASMPQCSDGGGETVPDEEISVVELPGVDPEIAVVWNGEPRNDPHQRGAHDAAGRGAAILRATRVPPRARVDRALRAVVGDPRSRREDRARPPPSVRSGVPRPARVRSAVRRVRPLRTGPAFRGHAADEGGHPDVAVGRRFDLDHGELRRRPVRGGRREDVPGVIRVQPSGSTRFSTVSSETPNRSASSGGS